MTIATKSKFAKTVGVTTGFSALFAAGLTFAAIASVSAANADNTARPSDQVKTAPAVLSVLADGQKSGDILPKERWKAAGSMGESGLKLSTTRLLGQDAAGSYWAGEDNSGNVCMILSLPSGGMSSACSTVENFMQHGLGNSYHEPQLGEYIEAYLVPDGVVTAAVGASLQPMGGNLLVGDTRKSWVDQSAVTLKSQASGGFEINLLAPAQAPSKG